MDKLTSIIRDLKLSPIETTESSRKQLLVLDINVLPYEIKLKSVEEIVKEYRDLYPDYEFLLIDTSRNNMEGTVVTKYPPVYAI